MIIKVMIINVKPDKDYWESFYENTDFVNKYIFKIPRKLLIFLYYRQGTWIKLLLFVVHGTVYFCHDHISAYMNL